MINDRHRQLADELVESLKKSNAVDEYELRRLGGEIYDVMTWLKEFEIISQAKVGMPFTKGKKFATYKSLDLLISQSEYAQQTIIIGENKGQVFQSRDDNSLNKTETINNKSN
jgi:hypothetical protein